MLKYRALDLWRRYYLRVIEYENLALHSKKIIKGWTASRVQSFFLFILVEQLKARRMLLLEQSGCGPGLANSGPAAAGAGLLLASPAAEDAWQLLLQHPEQADPASGGPTHAILIAMECLAMLNRLPEAVETLNTELQAQLFQIMTRTTHQIIGFYEHFFLLLANLTNKLAETEVAVVVIRRYC